MITCRPLLLFAVLAVLPASASAGLSQVPAPTPATPGPEGAPVERRPPAEPEVGPDTPRPGMQDHRKSGGNFHHTGPVHRQDGFQGGPGGMREGSASLGAGLHILPPGMWWKNAGLVERLGLTPVQTKKMDDIFQRSRLQLIDLKANVEKQDVILEPMLSANPPDTAKALMQIDKVAQARADLEKADARMLLGIRGVLTPDQWTKLHAQRGPGGGAAGPGQGGGSQPGGGQSGPHGSAGMNMVAPGPQP